MNRRDHRFLADVICSYPAKAATRARMVKYFAFQLKQKFGASFAEERFRHYCAALLKAEDEMMRKQ